MHNLQRTHARVLRKVELNCNSISYAYSDTIGMEQSRAAINRKKRDQLTTNTASPERIPGNRPLPTGTFWTGAALVYFKFNYTKGIINPPSASLVVISFCSALLMTNGTISPNRLRAVISSDICIHYPCRHQVLVTEQEEMKKNTSIFIESDDRSIF